MLLSSAAAARANHFRESGMAVAEPRLQIMKPRQGFDKDAKV